MEFSSPAHFQLRTARRALAASELAARSQIMRISRRRHTLVMCILGAAGFALLAKYWPPGRTGGEHPESGIESAALSIPQRPALSTISPSGQGERVAHGSRELASRRVDSP